MASSSRLFEAYRTVGLVTDDIPFSFSRLGKERFITTSVGRSFLVYNVDKLLVRMVSTPPNGAQLSHGSISCIESFRETTYTGFGNCIVEWERGKMTRVLYDGDAHSTGSVVALLLFGDLIVAALNPMFGAKSTDAGTLAVIAVKSGNLVSHIKLGQSMKHKTASSPTCMIHPDTYLNKVLVGNTLGQMELINIRTGKLVYRFSGLSHSSSSSKRPCAVLCVSQSPATDVVGVGLADGTIAIHNLRLDTCVMKFNHTGGAVTSLTFRSDTGGPQGFAPFAMMVSGNSSGELAVWDLDERRLASVVKDAHEGAVTRAFFFPNEPLLASAGVDNCLKIFIFDQEDGQMRLLKFRRGHKSPPTKIQYYGGDTLSTLSSGADAAVCHILSAGRDRAFRIFHTVREQLNVELSQGPLIKKGAKSLDVRIDQLKLPPIIDFAATEARQRDWCNILSAHRGEGAAFTWSLENRVIGAKVLRPDGDSGISLKQLRTDQMSARASKFPAITSVAISACGNFGLVGTISGVVFKYNMQSGLPRGSFPKPSAAHLSKEEMVERQQKRRKLDPSSIHLLPELQDSLGGEGGNVMAGLEVNPDRHDGRVNGVGVNAINSIVFSAGYDGTLRFWDFVSHGLKEVVDVGSPVSKCTVNRDAGLLALSCDDLSIVVFDIETRRPIRTFKGHNAAITSMEFTRDARWLASAGTDTSLRIWDLSTARCIDWMEFPSPVTSLTFSPTGEFMATSFADSVGITLWASKPYFGTAKADMIARKPIFVQVPSASIVLEDGEMEESFASDDEDESLNAASIEEYSGVGEVNFSGADLSKWYTLAHLDVIKERNKPKEAPQKPEKAPFFLPTTKSVNPSFTPSNEKEQAVATAGNTEEDMLMQLEQVGDWSDEEEDSGEQFEENESDDDGSSGSVAAPSHLLRKSNSLSKPRSKLFFAIESSHATYKISKSKEKSIGVQDGKHFEEVVVVLKEMSPSAIDFEIRSIALGPEDDDGAHLIGLMMDWLMVEFHCRQHFELCQAVAGRLLALHSEVIEAREELRMKVDSLHKEQMESWKILQGKMKHALCLLGFFSHQQ